MPLPLSLKYIYLYENISYVVEEMEKYIYISLTQCKLKSCKGELEISGDKVTIKPGRNLKVKMIAERHSTSGQNIKSKERGKAQSDSS